jgi:hypothetical protein
VDNTHQIMVGHVLNLPFHVNRIIHILLSTVQATNQNN